MKQLNKEGERLGGRSLINADDVIKDAEKPKLTKKEKVFQTAVVYCIYFGLGMFAAIYGPTLPDLQRQTQVDTKRGALLFTFGGIGRILGSFMQIIFYEILGTWLLLLCCVTMMPVVAFALPHITHYSVLALFFFVQGVCAGTTGSVSNAFVFELWTLKAGPFIQGLHLTISIGSAFSAILAKFFLQPTIRESSAANENNSSYNTSVFNSSSTESFTTNDDIMYPYLAIALYHLVIAVIVLYYFANDNFTVIKRKYSHKRATKTNAKPSVLLALLFGVPMFCFGGFEVAFSGLLLSFVTEEVAWTNEAGALLTAVFWVSMAIGRMISTILAKFFKPRGILAVNSLALFTTFLLMSFAYRYHHLVMWMSTCVVGLTLAPIVANTLSQANSYIGVYAWVTAMHMCCLYTGVISIPALTAYIYKTYTAGGFLYVGVGITALSVAAYVAIEIIFRCSPPKKIPPIVLDVAKEEILIKN
ncbi:hypothetical protein CAPTEDRAFT_214144 [Capitella teleta]|uniref:Major facilitator superfamily (MFS) profile domain-containing protein n=1 Tax=Capitella teleta TaxID=283909 RepID=R7TK11_CAPTE|nr:hypothetical protein CAPTEDRAFT_214144 [Capitella teleta]|eukprot:ELT94168.1 hypothetical protein CAPTEDRAFT_214144 [Capitella teleta]